MFKMIALFVAAPVVGVISMMQSSSSLAYSYTARQRQQQRIGGHQWGGRQNYADRVGTVQLKLEQHHPRWTTVSNIMIKRSLLTAMGRTNGNDDEFDMSFDPFLQSPLSFGETTTITTSEEEEATVAPANNGRNFGFLSYAQNHVGSTTAIATSSVATSSMQQEQVDIISSSSTDFAFDPLLSPHVYTNGIDAGPSMQQTQQTQQQQQQQQKQQKRLGIILIDHGSKRQASNDHIHKIAQLYEQSLQLTSPSSSSNNNIRQQYSGGSVVVKAAHMEIASPSILDTIRNIITTSDPNNKVTSIICIPYFLSPGRHATEDVPELINQARDILRQEGLLTVAPPGAETDDDDDDDNKDDEISIVMSDALGTHIVGMLSVVDDLVLQTLNNM
jgi:hypothetical protein